MSFLLFIHVSAWTLPWSEFSKICACKCGSTEGREFLIFGHMSTVTLPGSEISEISIQECQESSVK